MQGSAAVGEAWDEVERLAQAVVALGVDVGLPFVAAQSDLGDPEPMADAEGNAYAERLPWIGSAAGYWRDRRLALKSTFLAAARVCAEPIWFADGRLGTWRTSSLLDPIDVSEVAKAFGFSGAVIAPAHLPAGRIGAVVWVATAPVDVPGVFAQNAERMFTLALRFLATHAELSAPRCAPGSAQLSAREAQCVRWAAAGKTNAEIGSILSLSVSTVRFHLRNAGTKLGAATRGRMIQAATGQGYLGANV